MQTLYVRDVMSSPVVMVRPTTPLPQVNSLMREQHIRHLPVVDRDRLVGLITFGDVHSAIPADATRLSVFELAYAMDRVTAADVMHKDVITIGVSDTLTQAAQRMLDHKISSLPVLEYECLVGMITESDIFRAITSGLLVAANSPDALVDAPPRTSRSGL